MTDQKLLRLYALRHQFEFVISSLAMLSMVGYISILIYGLILAFTVMSSLQVILWIALPFVLVDHLVTSRVAYFRGKLNLVRTVINRVSEYSDQELRVIVETLELYTPRIPRVLREIPANRTARWSKMTQQPLPRFARCWVKLIERY